MSNNILSSSIEEIINNPIQVEKKKLGRRPRDIQFPTNEAFTIQEMREKLLGMNQPMTTAAISVRLKKLVEQRKYEVIGKRIEGRGQPARVYRSILE